MIDTGKIFSYAHFSEQMTQFWEEYGLIWLSATILGGITIGLVAHYFNHTAPLAKVKQLEKNEDEDCEDEDKTVGTDEQREHSQDYDNAALDSHLQSCFGKAGIMKGRINKTLISSLPKRSFVEKSDRGLASGMTDIESERQKLLAQKYIAHAPATTIESDKQIDDSEEGSDSEIEEIQTEGVLSEEQNRRLLNKEVDVTNCPTEHSERDLLNMLGNLHGKLATAQLRAKTRQMAQDMSAEERQTEADMKARQLESIMNLMLQNQEKFGLSSDEVKEQLNLYNF